jgi:NTE family protein
MNAAVLISNVVNRKKTWEEAAKELENFWIDEKKGLSSTPGFSNLWWDEARKQNKFSASAEAARKYYPVKEYLKYGTQTYFRLCHKNLIPNSQIQIIHGLYMIAVHYKIP